MPPPLPYLTSSPLSNPTALSHPTSLENVLATPDGVATALQCIRAWAAEAEVSA
jgi:hypothetical protein